jgi:hypothetical protein
MPSLPGASGSLIRRRFQAGGTVRENALYVERPADRELPEALKQRELCFVLATRQIGKSSLRLRAANKLSAEGVACVHIDLTMLGTGTATAETWYFGLAAEIADQLDLPRPDDFWEAHKALGPVHGWSRYLEDEVLARADRPIVVFVDEIDATLSLPFSRDDFSRRSVRCTSGASSAPRARGSPSASSAWPPPGTSSRIRHAPRSTSVE